MKEYKTYLPKYSLVKEISDFKKVNITGSTSAAEYMHNFYASDIEIVESFFVLMLNHSNNTIGYVKISEGGITGTLVDVRVVAHYAVQSLATGVILAHNHPSGMLKISEADKLITKKLKEGLALLDIAVIDHIILVAKKENEVLGHGINYTSFVDEGLI